MYTTHLMTSTSHYHPLALPWLLSSSPQLHILFFLFFNSLSSMCVAHINLDVGPPTVAWLTTSGHTPGENSFFQQSTANSSTAGGGGTMGLFPLHAGMLTDLTLYYNCCEFMEAKVLSCPEDTGLVSSRIFPPLLRYSLNLEGSKCDIDVVLRTPWLLILI